MDDAEMTMPTTDTKPRRLRPDLIQSDLLIGAGLLALAIAAPFVIESKYLIGQMIIGLFWASIAVQWNLLFGYAGVFSLAQMALFAVGGYGTAMLSIYLGFNIWLAILSGAVVATLVSMLVGLACLRLEGVYVALLTFAIANVLYFLIMTDTACYRMNGTTCLQFTGGAAGFSRFGEFGTRALLRGEETIHLRRDPRPWWRRGSLSTVRWVWPFVRCATISNMPLRAGSTGFTPSCWSSGSRPFSPG